MSEKDVFRLLEHLINLLELLEQTKCQYEAVCGDARDLMKPWVKNNDTAHGNPTTNADNSKVSKTTIDEKADIPVEEVMGIDLLHQVLNRAQKTRQAHNKVNKHMQLEDELAVTDCAYLKKDLQHQIKNSTSAIPLNDTKKTRVKLGTSTQSNTGLGKSISRSNASSKSSNTENNVGTISQTHLQKLIGSKQSHVPAHVKAPFQTKVQTSVSRVTRPTSKKALKANPKQSGIVKGPPVSNADPQPLNSATCSSSKSCEPLTTCESKNNLATFEDIVPSLNALTLNEATDSKPKVTDDSVPNHSNKFYLLQEGSKLTVPAKVLKLNSHNKKLRKKVGALSVTRKVEPTNPRLQFQNRLQQYINDMYKDDQLQLLSYLQHHTDVYNRLSRLEGAITDGVSEGCSWQDILKTKKFAEYLLSAFDKMENQYQILIKELKKVIDIPARRFPRITPFLTQSSQLPSFLKSGLIAGDPTDAPVMYHSLKELQRWTTLLHTVNELKLQLWIQQQVADSMLPHLSVSQESPSVPVYRTAYSLLCSAGRSLPAIVRDTIDDLDVSES